MFILYGFCFLWHLKFFKCRLYCCAYIIEMPAAVFPQKSKQTAPRNLKDIEVNFQITKIHAAIAQRHTGENEVLKDSPGKNKAKNLFEEMLANNC